ncbi:MAG: NYN domain-containing protein [Chloroflexota bacterium]
MVSLNIDVANLPREAIERLVELAPEQGRVLTRRAFGDFRREDMDDLAIQLYQYGFQLVHCPAWPNQRGRLKSVVDDVMAQDLRDQMEFAPEVEVFILGSGDRNFIAVANALKRHGKKVVVAADQESINRELRLCADEYLALPRHRGRQLSHPEPEPEPEIDLPSGAELLERVRGLSAATDYLTLRRIVRALLPDDGSGTGRVRSTLANHIQELIDAGHLYSERRVIRGRTVITLVLSEGDAIPSNGDLLPPPQPAESPEPSPAPRRRVRRKTSVSTAS